MIYLSLFILFIFFEGEGLFSWYWRSHLFLFTVFVFDNLNLITEPCHIKYQKG